MMNIIPIPASISLAEGSFDLTTASRIFVDPDTPEMLNIGKFLSTQIHKATGIQLPISSIQPPVPEAVLQLTIQSGESALGVEGYSLKVTPQVVHLTASQPAGAFYGVQTLLQLLPPKIEDSPVQMKQWLIPSVSIRDWPRFSWRGTMLDIARHFFEKEDVKRYIDLLAMYKLNILHLHMTDDQGWRIEIHSWPNLTSYGGETAAGGGPGGFYTKAQFSDIVEYARQRYVTIVPEIDMPGHTNAALASYPELNPGGKAPARYTGMEVGFSSLFGEKEITYKFVHDVLQELSLITPGPYLHIGGDEALSTPKSIYKTFIERIEPMVIAYGKQMVGWEEIVQCNLSSSAIVQYWKDIALAQMAIQKGQRIILSPASKTYLDMKYDADTPLGQSWAGLVDVEKCYCWDPANEVSSLHENLILGIEAPLWTETITTMKELEYMAFPRLLGIAEIGWSPESGREWESYRQRLAAHGKRLNWMGVNFYPDPKIPWI